MVLKSFKLLGLLVFVSACSSRKETSTDSKSTMASPPPTLKVAFGSCNNQNEDQSYWAKILSKAPQVWIWLGDNIYGDTRNPRALEAKYKKQLKHPEYMSVMSQVRVTGTWDDHDYGENDAGADFPMKRKSKELFWDFMQVPKGDILRMQNGVYRSETWTVGSKKVKLIVLDARYNREALKQNSVHEYIPTDGDILGEQQWLWFEKELTESSDVDALLVANGTQVLGDQHRFEKWANFPKSKERLLSLLSKSPVSIKVILSGDRHFAEISQLQVPGSVPITEVVASGLTHSYVNADEPNPLRVGSLWTKRSYGLAEFVDSKGVLSLKLSVQDLESNQSVNSVEIKGVARVSESR